MAKCRSAVDLKDWVLRSLGAPQIQVEVTNEQVFDCIDEAIELFTEYHYDGCNRNVLFCRVDEEMASQRSVYLDSVFSVNTVISSGQIQMGNSAMASGFMKLFYGHGSAGSSYGHQNMGGMFSELNGFNMVSYHIWMQFQHEWNVMFNPETRFEFNGQTKELRILDDVAVDSIIAFDVYTPIGTKIEDSYGAKGGDTYNPEHGADARNPQFIGGEIDDEFPYFDQKIYDHRWIKEFTRASVKRILGTIHSRFEGVRLPGGATVNGERMYEQAITEMEKLREELDNLDDPTGVFLG
jgi:hypothetical protein